MTMVGSLPNLEVLKLKDHALQGTVWEPNEGEFCRLKLLVIHMSFLEHWKANETHFPSLQCLRLFYCINLVEIPSEIGDIPTLQAIHLYECSPSAETSARLIQEEQEGLGNDDFQLLVRTLFDEKEMRYPPAGEDAMRVSCAADQRYHCGSTTTLWLPRCSASVVDELLGNNSGCRAFRPSAWQPHVVVVGNQTVVADPQ
ncbi:putative late blight resistance protein-like protein R1A-10 [Forsythia ovata]|uniref:Late blight resistance protein-like protein R1A-10 n=1 Tax=Forsythia ovata TaxID=205694 RepID=A0ABD1TRS6_9LAMI